MFVLNKIKAGALQMTIYICVVIALLLFSFVLFVHTHSIIEARHEQLFNTVQLSNYGIEYGYQNSIDTNDTLLINYGNDDEKNSKLKRDYWGIYQKVSSIATHKSYQIKKVALIGRGQTKENRTALYLQDNNTPLTLVGNTQITGTAYLPDRGVKSGNISGEHYYGSALIYGNQKLSFELPELHSETLQEVLALKKKYLNLDQQQFLNLHQSDTITNSFLNPTKIIYSDHSLHLSEVKIVGNIIVQSKTKITVHASSALKDIILIAPEVELLSGVKGNFQVVSDSKITTHDNVTLNYPSALLLLESESQNIDTNQELESSKILIASNNTIKGTIVFNGTLKNNMYKPQIDISENATIHGEIYCNQNINLKGRVNGSVYTNSFITNHNGSIYMNHIYNGIIDVESLTPHFAGLSLLESEQTVAKWLY